ncbi:hypothetical protein COP1_004469 [Malus domestica]
MILLSRLLLIAGHDRFRILSAHPEMNLLAAGHDSGMIVFKLERERPAFSVSGDSMYHVKDRFLRFYEFSTQRGTQIIPIRRRKDTILQPYRKCCFDIFGRGDTAQEAKRGIGGPAVFVAPNRFAVLEKSTNQVIAKNLKNEIVKKSALPIVAEVKNDVMGQFHNALYLGDIRERVKILENAGHLPLAYSTAVIHGSMILLNIWRLNWEIMFLFYPR